MTKTELVKVIDWCLEELETYHPDSTHNEMDVLLTRLHSALAQTRGVETWNEKLDVELSEIIKS